MLTSTHPTGATAPLVDTTPAEVGPDGTLGRVLIVDDDPVLRQICAINLTAAGLHVLEAGNGLDGLEQALRGHPDLIVTDVEMPGLGGFELAERLRLDDRTRRIPVVFLTGETGRANAERADALGARAYLTKPFDPDALAAFVVDEIETVRCLQ